MASPAAATSLRVLACLVAGLASVAGYFTYRSIRSQQAELNSLGTQLGTLGQVHQRLDSLEHELADGTSVLKSSRAQLETDIETMVQRATALEARTSSLPSLREELTRIGEELAALAQRFAALKLPDEQVLLQRAEASASLQVQELARQIEQLKSQVPTRDQLEAEVARSLASKQQEIARASAQKLLASSADQLQTLGLAALVSLDPDTFLSEVRAYLSRADPSRSPETVRLALGLLGESNDTRFHLALVDAASGQLNPRIMPQALVVISTVDLKRSSPEIARRTFAGVLKAPLIDEPDRFNTIVDIMRSAVGTQPTREDVTPVGESLETLRAPFLQFWRNYLASRLLGYEAVTTFPVTVEKLGPASAPQLSASNRERALYLCRAARAVGVERDAAGFLLQLLSKTTPLRGNSEEQPRVFLIKLLEELSGLKHGEDWARWRAWAEGNS